jgi:hypothetical protein
LRKFLFTRKITCKDFLIFFFFRLSFLKVLSFSLPAAKIANPDVTRLINSDEIQSVVRPAGQKTQKRPWTQKKNPLVNKAILFRLNPYAKTLRRQEIRTYHPILNTFWVLTNSANDSQARAFEKEEAQAGFCVQGFPRRSLCPLIA